MRGLATSQIILLIMGIIVLAIIGYLVYSQYMSTNTQLGYTNCQNNLVSICTSCRTCVTGMGQSWTTDNCPHKTSTTFTSCDSMCTQPKGCPKTIGNTQCKASDGTTDLIDPTECQAVGVS